MQHFDFKGFRSGIEKNGGRASLSRILDAGCPEVRLLAALSVAVQATPETVFKWPDSLETRTVDDLLRTIRELQTQLRKLETTAIGVCGSLTLFRAPTHVAHALQHLPGTLTMAEVVYEDVKNDVKEFGPVKRRQVRAMMHAGISMLVYATTRQWLYQDTSQLIEASYRSFGIDISVSADSIKKFRERHPKLAASTVLQFMSKRDATKIRRLLDSIPSKD